MATYIAHHGIKGQKWGVRRFQNKDGTRTAAGKKHVEELNSRKGLSDNQKKAIKIGAAVVATALVTVGGVYLYKNTNIKNLVKSGKRLVDDGSGDINIGNIKSHTKSTNMTDSILDRAHEVNKKLKSEGVESPCTNIFLQMEAESRGIIGDAKAPLRKTGNDYSDVLKCFKNGDIVNVASPMSQSLKGGKAQDYFIRLYGNNAKGYIGGNIKDATGKIERHAFRWEVNNGVLSAYDGPNSSKAIRYFDMLIDVKNENGLQKTNIFRTDNLEMDLENLQNHLTNIRS